MPLGRPVGRPVGREGLELGAEGAASWARGAAMELGTVRLDVLSTGGGVEVCYPAAKRARTMENFMLMSFGGSRQDEEESWSWIQGEPGVLSLSMVMCFCQKWACFYTSRFESIHRAALLFHHGQLSCPG